MNSSTPIRQQLVGHLLWATHDGGATVDPHRRDTVPQVGTQSMPLYPLGLGLLAHHGSARKSHLPLLAHPVIRPRDELVGGSPRLFLAIPHHQVGPEAERGLTARPLEVLSSILETLGHPLLGLDPAQVNVPLPTC